MRPAGGSLPRDPCLTSASLLRYLLKGALLTQDPEYLHMFNQAYTAVTNSLKLGAWYVEVNMDSGLVVWPTFSSLQCFWPGMQWAVSSQCRRCSLTK